MFADAGLYGVFIVGGIFFVLFLLPIIIVLEALILRGLKWGTLRASFVDSLVINLISAVFGFVFYVVGLSPLSYGVGTELLVFFVLTVLIEGGVLTFLKRHPRRQTWVAAIVVNLASYALLFVLLYK